MRNHAFLVALALVVTACSHGQSATTTTTSSTQPDSTVAQPSPGSSDSAPPSTSPESTAASTGDASTGNASTDNASTGNASTATQCDILSNAQVEDVLHLKVKAVRAGTPNTCEFSFASQSLTKVLIQFSPSGGKDEIDSTRKAAGGAAAIVGGIFNAAGGNSSDAQAAKSMAVGTPPPDLPKVGDDQYAYSVGPLTSLIATKGDAYVNVGISFAPDGVSRWQALPELARRVLAAH